MFLSSKQFQVLETSSTDSGNTITKTFLISVLENANLNNVFIGEKEGKKYHKTIINKPVVAFLKRDKNGKADDFGGHELRLRVNSDGELEYYFGTAAIGTHTDAWIEKREVSGYEGEVDCILVKAEFWASRFPEYWKVAEKLIDDGKLGSSWEIDVQKYSYDNGIKKLEEFEFVGNALLGSDVTPAVDGAGYVEVSEYDEALSIALQSDIMCAEAKESEKEESASMNEELNVVVVSEEDVQITEPEITEPVVAEENVITEPVAEVVEPVVETVAEVASLDTNDIFNQLYRLLNPEGQEDGNYRYVSSYPIVHYPAENRAIFPFYGSKKERNAMYIEVIYAVAENVVSVVSETVVEMVFMPVESYNSELSAKDNKISELSENLINLNNEINAKSAEIASLDEIKVKYNQIVEAEQEAEKQNKINSLKEKYLATKLISEKEFAEDEAISKALSELDENALKLIVADRVMEGKKVAVAEKVVKEVAEEKVDISGFIGVETKANADSIRSYIFS